MPVLAALLALQDVWVTFKDGSCVRARWTDRSVRFGERDIEVAGIRRFVPGVYYSDETMASIRTWVEQLGDDKAPVREEATRKLVAHGPIARELLEKAAGSSDPEVGWRARYVLSEIDSGTPTLPAARPDRVHLDSGISEGRLAGKTFALRVRTRDLQVPVDAIEEVSTRQEPKVRPPARFRRLKNEEFKEGIRTLDFDKAPDGAAIARGSDIETVYAPWGVVLDSELENGLIYADSYVVAGRSQGNSAANKEPLWSAHVNFYFYIPGTIPRGARRGVPGGVYRAGVFVAAVSPKGTGMRAYGLDGRVLHEIWTEGSGTDFLGLESTEPIHRVEILDNPQIDSNFTTDDFMFGEIVDAGSRRKEFVASLAGGDRWTASEVSVSEGRLRLKTSLGEFELPLDELEVLSMPLDGLDPAAAISPGGQGPHSIHGIGGAASGTLQALGSEGVVLDDRRTFPLKSVIRIAFK
jgi:hypothetical protein